MLTKFGDTTAVASGTSRHRAISSCVSPVARSRWSLAALASLLRLPAKEGQQRNSKKHCRKRGSFMCAEDPSTVRVRYWKMAKQLQTAIPTQSFRKFQRISENCNFINLRRRIGSMEGSLRSAEKANLKTILKITANFRGAQDLEPDRKPMQHATNPCDGCWEQFCC